MQTKKALLDFVFQAANILKQALGLDGMNKLKK